ncbi:MAG: hypothetical protein QME68_00975 [Elusimicrobiota bacterium]|nr:hypothetical protein [Elusimicrobiota bacterium]
MVALIIGLIVAVVAAYVGLAFWLEDVVVVLKGSIPLMFFCGGLLAVIAGITSIKDEIEAKKLEEERKKEEEKKEETKPAT